MPAAVNLLPVRARSGKPDEISIPGKFAALFMLLALHDVAIVSGAGYAAWLLYARQYDYWFANEYGKDVLVACAIVPWLFQIFGCYRPRQPLSLSFYLQRPLLALATLFMIVLALGFMMKSLDTLSRGFAVLWVVLSVTGILSSRFLGWLCVRRLVAAGALREKIAIVGCGAWGETVATRLAARRKMAAVVGMFDDRARDREPCQGAIRMAQGSIDELLEYGRRNPLDRIIVTLPASAEDRLANIFLRLKGLAVDIFFCPPEMAGLGLLSLPVTRFAEMPLFQVADRPLSPWPLAAKAALDKILALGLLVLLGPMLLLTALVIKLDSRGPVFFRQRRYGFNGREILVWKFRTMYADRGDGSGEQQTRRADPRVTRVGAFLRKTSIDELPQLFNVLAGEMSIVGPRPHPVGMRTDNRLCKEIVAEYAHRYRVRPGITGLAQVSGYRGATDTADRLLKRVEYDLYYIENWSIALDLKILVLTGVRVLTMRDAY